MAATTDELIRIDFHNGADAFAPQSIKELDDERSREVWEDFADLCYPSGFVTPDPTFVTHARERQPLNEGSMAINDDNREQTKRRIGGQSPVRSGAERLDDSLPHVREVLNHQRRTRIEEGRLRSKIQSILSEVRCHDGEQEQPNSGLGGKKQQNAPITTKTAVSGGGHSESNKLAKARVDLADARRMIALPETENHAELWYNSRNSGILTVRQAENIARFSLMGCPSLFMREPVHVLKAPPTRDPHTVKQQPAFDFGDWLYNEQGERLLHVQAKQTQGTDALKTAAGHVFTLGAQPHEQAGFSAEATVISQPRGNEAGTKRGRGRPPGRGRGMAGGAIRGCGGMGRGRGGITKPGRATTGRGGGTRGERRTPLARQVISGQIDWSQVSSTLSMHVPSFTTSQNSHKGSSQANDMQILSIPQPQQPTQSGKEQEYPKSNARGWPSGFIPRGVMKMMAARPPVPSQRQGGPTITSRGPIPGTSYIFPQLEEGRMAAHSLSRQGAFQQAVPIKSQQLSKSQYMSGSPLMAGPQNSFAYRERRNGEYGMRMERPLSAAGGPQQAYPSPPQPPCKPVIETAQFLVQEWASRPPLPCPPQQPDVPYVTQMNPQHAKANQSQGSVIPHLAQAGPQQAYPSPSLQPTMPYFTQGGSQRAGPKPLQQSVMSQLAQIGPQQAYPSPSLQPTIPYFTQGGSQRAGPKPSQQSAKPQLAQACPQQAYPSPSLQPTKPYFTQGGPQQAYPNPSQPPALPQLTQPGPQQAYPIPFPQPTNAPGPTTAEATPSRAPPSRDEGRAANRSEQDTQTEVLAPVVEDEQVDPIGPEMKEFEAAANDLWEALRVGGETEEGGE